MNKIRTIYLDMDGVLADFNQAAKLKLKASEEEHLLAEKNNRWSRQLWEQLKLDPHFYRHLPKTVFADELAMLARNFRDKLQWELKILTAIPSGNDMPWAFYDKVLWQQQYYPDIPVMFGPYSRDKHLHCKTNEDILVDDRWTNCESWSKANGIAIQVKTSDPAPALTKLKEIFFNQTQKLAYP